MKLTVTVTAEVGTAESVTPKVPAEPFSQAVPAGGCASRGGCVAAESSACRMPAGVSGGDDAGWDVAGDHAASPDRGVRADRDPRTHDCAAAKPHVGADADRRGQLTTRVPHAGVHRVGGGINVHPWSEQGPVAYHHLRTVKHHAADIYVHARANHKLRAVVAAKRGLDLDIFAHGGELPVQAGTALVSTAPGSRDR
jgi:hypothetical protein